MKRYKNASDIKVGVVGYGGAFNMGRAHLTQMQDAGMTPLAVAEIDPQRLAVAREDFPGIETYRSLGEMLRNSEVDLVAIITPHNTHAKLGLQCLRAKRHVVCEKPLAITTAECDAMIREAKKEKLVLSTYHNRHWDGCILAAMKVVKSGALGDIVRVDAQMGKYGQPKDWWRSSRSVSGGVFYDWGVHLLEYTLQIVDDEISEVVGFSHWGHWAKTSPYKDDANEDEALAIVRFKKGAWAQMTISTIDMAPRPRMLRITGTEGVYVFDVKGWDLYTTEKGALVHRTGENPPGEGWRFYKNVADHMAKGEKLVITPEWSRRPIHILDLAVKSAKTGKSQRARYH